METLKVAIANDHPIVLGGVRELVERGQCLRADGIPDAALPQRAGADDDFQPADPDAPARDRGKPVRSSAERFTHMLLKEHKMR